ncbi:mCG145591, partial [Mus musculus]
YVHIFSDLGNPSLAVSHMWHHLLAICPLVPPPSIAKAVGSLDLHLATRCCRKELRRQTQLSTNSTLILGNPSIPNTPVLGQRILCLFGSLSSKISTHCQFNDTI